jgi:hypothetical protein
LSAVAPLMIALALLVGCARTPPLPMRVGDRVELRGTLQGPGKVDVFSVRVQDDVVVLHDPAPLPALTDIGREATVIGTLERFEPPAEARCADPCVRAESPAYYFIRGAEVAIDR